MGYHEDLIQAIVDGRIKDKNDLQRFKIELCRKYGLDLLPRNSDTLARAGEEEMPLVCNILQRKPVRTLSGVAVVAVMTSPAQCPHGKCIYCPGGVENGSPQSYTGKEPAARRGASYGFDPYEQVKGRIEQIEAIGHQTDKIDLIIMGGTFTSRTEDYQVSFIQRCFDAMNGCSSASLEDAQCRNEAAEHRCIGLTMETRPDALTIPQIDVSMHLGMTRVEMGVQVLDDDILNAVNRGHGLQAIVSATANAKKAGLKICYHLMPGLPGSSPEKDLRSFQLMFEDERFRPDMLKIYPTLVVKGTKLYEMWSRGEYKPYSTEQAVKVMSDMKSIVPEYVRIQRIQRDIPVPLIEDGVNKGHLRELIKVNMAEHGQHCRCIRCREVGLMGIVDFDSEELKLKTLEYNASGGKEHFISLDLPSHDALVGYARLRTGDGEVAGLRELKVFGKMMPLRTSGEGWQHRGHGKELLSKAEDIARNEGCKSIRVTSGVGVRLYYSALGYHKDGVYMVKDL